MKQLHNNVKTPILTEAEVRVIELLVRGYSEKEIANKLCLSKYTVNNHMRNIRERYGLNKSVEVVLLYIAYLKGKTFSLKILKEVGLSAILVFVNICQYT